MSNQIRVQALLREAANLLEGDGNRNASTSASASQLQSPSVQLQNATRALFQPYSRSTYAGYRGRRRGRTEPQVKFWSHRFCALAVCSQDNTGDVEETCIHCGDFIPLRCLWEHVTTCSSMEKTPSPRMVQMPVCQFTCGLKTESEGSSQRSTMPNPSSSEGQCPLCGLKFRADLLVSHAASCGESSDSAEKSLDETLQNISMTLEKESWTIDVVRRQSLRTAIEQLEESSKEDWQRQLKVKFVGEEGVDGGGLTREFFSLLFTNEELFEHSGFHFDSQIMTKRIYLLGEATAMALLSGHPGPQCFNKYIAEYICSGQIPNMGEFTDKDIGSTDVLSVIVKQFEEERKLVVLYNTHTS